MIPRDPGVSIAMDRSWEETFPSFLGRFDSEGEGSRPRPPADVAASSAPAAGGFPCQMPQQSWKTPRFLLKKELKNSYVGSLGRMVLPKKEAETHLPTLTSREGIRIKMTDMLTSQVWTFKYRFWPNNRSRMYVLENIGDFVKTHCLRCGDFVMLYKDDFQQKYIIRAQKVHLEHSIRNESDKHVSIRDSSTSSVAALARAQEENKEMSSGVGTSNDGLLDPTAAADGGEFESLPGLDFVEYMLFNDFKDI